MRIEWIMQAESAALPEAMQALLGRVGDAALRCEGLAGRYQVCCVLTDDSGIAEVNRAQRGIDRPTDVLSFPAARFPAGETAARHPGRLRRELDGETGCIHLGDIVLSLQRARAQAGAYGHPLDRELGFLFAHGLLHLMGYDHESDDQRAAMRAMEERIMKESGLPRTLPEADLRLVEGAREAMERAYAPYSRYKVGACLRTTDGQLHKGCNVENASFGMTLCAERNAITTAVTEGMRGVEAIAIAAEGPMPYPCGACRQVLREFGTDIRVLLVNGGTVIETTLQALLPDSFGPEFVHEVKA